MSNVPHRVRCAPCKLNNVTKRKHQMVARSYNNLAPKLWVNSQLVNSGESSNYKIELDAMTNSSIDD